MFQPDVADRRQVAGTFVRLQGTQCDLDGKLRAIAPLAAPDWPADVASEAPVIRVSDRGWIGEPWDTVAPNTPYPPRLADQATRGWCSLGQRTFG